MQVNRKAVPASSSATADEAVRRAQAGDRAAGSSAAGAKGPREANQANAGAGGAVETANCAPRRETALQPSCCEGYVFIPCSAGKLGVKEDDGERAGALPLGEHVPGLPGRNLPRHRPSISANGRQPGGPAASPEADRGQGRRRAPPDAGRLPEGPPALRGQRRGGSRAARPLLGELIGAAALVCAGLVAGGCDRGTQRDEPQGQAGELPVPVTLVSANVGPKQMLPANGRIELGFDRLLQPASITRQTFSLQSPGGALVYTPNVAY